jgi:formamidopyrimidine-DNA glycosylase
LPELPEAETIARGLRPHLPGRRILEIEVLRPDVIVGSAEAFVASLSGTRVEGVGRRGKNLVLEISGGLRAVVNLCMTGRLLFASTPPAGGSEPTHPGVRITTSGGGTLWYDDARRFGRLQVMDGPSYRRWDRTLGPEPLGRRFTAEALHRSLAASRSPLRSWLLDQRKVAGVGNIYAVEALFLAGLHPRREARSVDRADARRLHREIRRVLRQAIRFRGTTLRDYRDASGSTGDNGPRLSAYGREGLPCVRCGTTIERIVISNRSAFLCPRCQPDPGR